MATHACASVVVGVQTALDGKKTTVPHCRVLVLEWLTKCVPLGAEKGNKAMATPGACGVL
jgi:hypothetical protein